MRIDFFEGRTLVVGAAEEAQKEESLDGHVGGHTHA